MTPKTLITTRKISTLTHWLCLNDTQKIANVMKCNISFICVIHKIITTHRGSV